jgi:hypothetical protein
MNEETKKRRHKVSGVMIVKTCNRRQMFRQPYEGHKQQYLARIVDTVSRSIWRDGKIAMHGITYSIRNGESSIVQQIARLGEPEVRIWRRRTP